MSFLKSPFNYTGSKYPQLEQLYSYFPKDCTTLVDLFCGGGSVFVNSSFQNIIINDIITDLTDFYYQLRTKQWSCILQNVLKYKINPNNQEEFVSLRQSYNKQKNCYKFFGLCSSCTNNMMRFNKKFQFNQTFGRRTINDNTIKKLFDYYNKIKSINSLRIFNKNFHDIEIQKDFFVYLDPPYLITQAGYNHYWSKQHQNKLYDYIIDLDNNGIKFGLSNMLYHKGIKNQNLDKLKKFNLHIIQSFQNKAKKKSKTEESVQIFITNY